MLKLIRRAWQIANLDGGFIIAAQIINFLFVYFFVDSLASLQKHFLLIAMFCMVNLSMIIFRVAGIANGVKFKPFVCLQQALYRWPHLAILYLFVAALLFLLNKYLANGAIAGVLLIPYIMLSSIFVIVHNKNAVQGILACYMYVRHKIAFSSMLMSSVLYTLPFLMPKSIYTDLFTTLWILFCHVLIVAIYAEKLERPSDNTKVVII